MVQRNLTAFVLSKSNLLYSSLTSQSTSSYRSPRLKKTICNRLLTTSSALDLLQISNVGPNSPLSYQHLRQSYFQAAKRCHPDLMKSESGSNNDSRSATKLFLQITDAYEFLLPHTIQGRNADSDYSIKMTKDEEMEYREACELWLGLSAEAVEDTKRCPLFRQWLMGNTDSAIKWNMFLCLNGGLAPRLQVEPILLIADGNASNKNNDLRNSDSHTIDGKKDQKRRRRRQTPYGA